MKREIKKTLNIPEGVHVKIDGILFFVKGPKGELKDSVKFRKMIKVEVKEDKIEISCAKASKNEKKIIGTIKSKIESMIIGVQREYNYQLQICSIHFPITIKIEKGEFIIKNFLGERKDRVLKLIPGVDVKVEGDIINVSSIDKEKAGQTAAGIETITRICGYDRRVFQDGIWITKKEKGKHKNE